MKKRILLFIIFFTSIFSFVTFLLIFNYLDPSEHLLLGVFFLVLTFLLSSSGFLTLVIYIFKKVYYRGEVFIYHVLNSFRQGFFISLFFLGIIYFNYLGLLLFPSSIALFFLLLFLELFIKGMS